MRTITSILLGLVILWLGEEVQESALAPENAIPTISAIDEEENREGIENITSFQGDATDLRRFTDNSFNVTLVLGPMYHLYETGEVNRAIDEAIRVTKPGEVLMFAFISVFAIRCTRTNKR